MSNDKFHYSLHEASKKLIHNYFNNKQNNVIDQVENLYLKKNADFRRFRQTLNINLIISLTKKAYLSYYT